MARSPKHENWLNKKCNLIPQVLNAQFFQEKFPLTFEVNFANF